MKYQLKTEIPGHKLQLQKGSFLSVLNGQVWECSCGQWFFETPIIGPYGKTSNKARIAAVRNAHHFHTKPIKRLTTN